jgi:hypothetical protein
MGILIEPSDLKYQYRDGNPNNNLPRFTGKPDPTPFDRNDIQEVIAMLEAVMKELDTYDTKILDLLEDIMNINLPKCIETREEVYDCLLVAAREWMELS